jgi:hypothetical protein
MAFRSATSGEVAEQVRPVWDPLGEPEAIGSAKDAIVIRSLRGDALDTILTFPSGEMMGPGGVRVFAAEPKWDIEDGKVLFGAGDEFREAVGRSSGAR